MQNFIYDIDTKIYFGKNQLDNLIIELNNLGAKKPLIVYGGGSIKANGIYQKIIMLSGLSYCWCRYS